MATLEPSGFNCLYARSSLSVTSGNFTIRVDPLCFDSCTIGYMFQHLWTLVFIAHLAHEETDLVKRMWNLVAQLVDEE